MCQGSEDLFGSGKTIEFSQALSKCDMMFSYGAKRMNPQNAAESYFLLQMAANQRGWVHVQRRTCMLVLSR